ncbi:MAG: type II toxin-antitoxin system HicA family toxin [Acidobacteriota bacterium]|nr:type II toxin-antitoxin system HicA family toxin [Acidobacteriota bacterium]MDQ3490539.1 type II toxin-antitoxin system HicA family toxin [Acidobacteriota bacterium]
MSGKEVVKVFESLGWEFIRQSGSHMVMTKDDEIASLSIPNHKEVAKGTLRSLIRAANLTADEFIKAI